MGHEDMLQTAHMFYDSALYKVALRYPPLSLNFDGLAFDDLGLPPTSEFYHKDFAIIDPTRFLSPKEGYEVSPDL